MLPRRRKSIMAAGLACPPTAAGKGDALGIVYGVNNLLFLRFPEGNALNRKPMLPRRRKPIMAADLGLPARSNRARRANDFKGLANFSQCPSGNGYFPQSLCWTEKIKDIYFPSVKNLSIYLPSVKNYIGISNICLRQFFSSASILKKIMDIYLPLVKNYHHFWTDTS